MESVTPCRFMNIEHCPPAFRTPYVCWNRLRNYHNNIVNHEVNVKQPGLIIILFWTRNYIMDYVLGTLICIRCAVVFEPHTEYSTYDIIVCTFIIIYFIVDTIITIIIMIKDRYRTKSIYPTAHDRVHAFCVYWSGDRYSVHAVCRHTIETLIPRRPKRMVVWKRDPSVCLLKGCTRPLFINAVAAKMT